MSGAGESPVAEHEAGLRLIIAYKTTKAVIWLCLATILGVGLRLRLTAAVQAAIEQAALRLSLAWAIRFAHWAADAITRQHVLITILVLTLDGVTTGIEGWALHHRKMWGEWLVIVTTGALLPFEGWAIWWQLKRHRTILWRVALLVVNLAIVAYLARRLQLQRRERRHAPLM